MNHAIKLCRISTKTLSSSSSSSVMCPISSRKGVGSVRLVQVSSGIDPKQSNFQNTDKLTKNPDQDNHLNAMEESFGIGYATRSDEEGFGCIYGGNDEDIIADMETIQDPGNQGSGVKEKGKARNQAQVK